MNYHKIKTILLSILVLISCNVSPKLGADGKKIKTKIATPPAVPSPAPTATPAAEPKPSPAPAPTPTPAAAAVSTPSPAPVIFSPALPLSFAQLATSMTTPSPTSSTSPSSGSSTASTASSSSRPETPSTPSSGSFGSSPSSPSHERSSSLRRIALRPIIKKIDVTETLERIKKYRETVKRIIEYNGHFAEFIFWMNETSIFLDETHLKEAFRGISKFKVKLKHAVKIKNAFSFLIEEKKKLLGEERYFEAQQIILGLTYTQSESASVWVEHERYKAEIIENYRAKITELDLLLFPVAKPRFVPAIIKRNI